jgi:hypothetical protein
LKNNLAETILAGLGISRDFWGGDPNIKNQKIEELEHRKFFRMIKMLKFKKITTSKV